MFNPVLSLELLEFPDLLETLDMLLEPPELMELLPPQLSQEHKPLTTKLSMFMNQEQLPLMSFNQPPPPTTLSNPPQPKLFKLVLQKSSRENPELNTFHSNKLLLTMKRDNMSREFQDKEPSLSMRREDTSRLSQEKSLELTTMPLSILNNIFLKLSLRLQSRWSQLRELLPELSTSQLRERLFTTHRLPWPLKSKLELIPDLLMDQLEEQPFTDKPLSVDQLLEDSLVEPHMSEDQSLVEPLLVRQSLEDL